MSDPKTVNLHSHREDLRTATIHIVAVGDSAILGAQAKSSNDTGRKGSQRLPKTQLLKGQLFLLTVIVLRTTSVKMRVTHCLR